MPFIPNYIVKEQSNCAFRQESIARIQWPSFFSLPLSVGGGGRNRIGRREKWPKKGWEEGEIGSKSREEGEIGLGSSGKGDLLPCSSPISEVGMDKPSRGIDTVFGGV